VNFAEQVREKIPEGGLFAGQEWRIAARAFPLEAKIAKELESLGRVLLQFNRAVNLLYRQSVAGKQPAWVAEWLDLGKPAWLVELQRGPAFKNEWPRVIRPDLLLTDEGIVVTELDSVPGGIGLTGWLNQAYAAAGEVLGGADGMIAGFASIFGKAARVHIVVSEESKTYRPEMEWVCATINGKEGGDRFAVRDASFKDFAPGDAVYRFFELFDTANVANARDLFAAASEEKILLTPPPKPIFEEKMLFALLWNRNLREFWRRELGEAFFTRMLRLTPYSWMMDPTPLPPQGAIPELNLTDWNQLKALSQKERNLILKVSGFSEHAWGARGVYLGSDLPLEDWSKAVDTALRDFAKSPYVLQRFHKPRTVDFEYFDFETKVKVKGPGRVRLSPYYFVGGEGDAARANLGGILATVVPADKKIVHGMSDAILAPCAVAENSGRSATEATTDGAV
jgi:hypothetical protein